MSIKNLFDSNSKNRKFVSQKSDKEAFFICEIGGGYGGLIHRIKKNFPFQVENEKTYIATAIHAQETQTVRSLYSYILKYHQLPIQSRCLYLHLRYHYRYHYSHPPVLTIPCRSLS